MQKATRKASVLRISGRVKGFSFAEAGNHILEKDLVFRMGYFIFIMQ